MTPRTKSWIALVIFLLAVPLAANLPLGAGLLLVLLAFIGYGIFQATLRCPRCGNLLVRRRVAGIAVYTPVAPHVCGVCALDLDSRRSGAQGRGSDRPPAKGGS